MVKDIIEKLDSNHESLKRLIVDSYESLRKELKRLSRFNGDKSKSYLHTLTAEAGDTEVGE